MVGINAYSHQSVIEYYINVCLIIVQEPVNRFLEVSIRFILLTCFHGILATNISRNQISINSLKNEKLQFCEVLRLIELDSKMNRIDKAPV